MYLICGWWDGHTELWDLEPVLLIWGSSWAPKWSMLRKKYEEMDPDTTNVTAMGLPPQKDPQLTTLTDRQSYGSPMECLDSLAVWQSPKFRD